MTIEDSIKQVRQAATNMATIAQFADVSPEAKRQIQIQVALIKEAIDGEA